MRGEYKEVLLKAADALEKFGLAVGTRKDSQGRMCALGALNFALTGTAATSDIDTKDGLLAFIVARLKLPVTRSWSTHAWAIADWSNSSDVRTVIEGFRKAGQ